MKRLSAVIITKNAEPTIADTLESLRFCDEVIVLDSGSSDRTREIAAGRGARVEVRPFDDFASQKNAAVALAAGEWVFSIDADEAVPPGLADEISAAVRRGDRAVYRVRRDTTFMGRTLRYGGHQSDRPIRLFPRQSARFEGGVHEALCTELPVRTLRSPLRHRSTPDIREYMKKLRHYTDLEACRLEASGIRVRRRTVAFKPFARFLQKYVVQLGFADGSMGLVYALLSGYYEFVRQAKFWQITRNDSANI